MVTEKSKYVHIMYVNTTFSFEISTKNSVADTTISSPGNTEEGQIKMSFQPIGIWTASHI